MFIIGQKLSLFFIIQKEGLGASLPESIAVAFVVYRPETELNHICFFSIYLFLSFHEPNQLKALQL